MRKVKVIKLPSWRISLDKIIEPLLEVEKKTLYGIMLAIYSALFLVIGFLWAVMEHKLLWS